MIGQTPFNPHFGNGAIKEGRFVFCRLGPGFPISIDPSWRLVCPSPTRPPQ